MGARAGGWDRTVLHVLVVAVLLSPLVMLAEHLPLGPLGASTGSQPTVTAPEELLDDDQAVQPADEPGPRFRRP